MRDYEKRITAMFLSSCSAEKAYEWLSENSMRFADEGVFHQRTLIRESQPLSPSLPLKKGGVKCETKQAATAACFV